MFARLLSILPLTCLLSLTVQAAEFVQGPIHIDQAQARASVMGQPSAAAYLRINNTGSTADKLKGGATTIAKSVEIHTMSMDGNVMRMREVSDITLPAGAIVTMKPGDGYHIMLIGLDHPLKAGEQFPLTLTFEKAGTVKVMVQVEGMAAKKSSSEHEHMH